MEHRSGNSVPRRGHARASLEARAEACGAHAANARGNLTRELLKMATCEVCGNDYDKSFEVIQDGKSHVFDSFECAIHAIAPVCDHRGCKIVGHGLEAGEQFFCCAHCAKHSGVPELKDRASHTRA